MRVKGIAIICEFEQPGKSILLEDLRSVDKVVEVGLVSCANSKHQESEASDLRLVVLRFVFTGFLEATWLEPRWLRI